MRDCFLVLGAAGDLAARLVLPGLVQLKAADELSTDIDIVGVDRQDWDDGDLREHLRSRFDDFGLVLDADARDWLLDRVAFVQADVTDADAIAGAVRRAGEEPCVAYLALPPTVFAPTLRALADADLPDGSVVVVEKPFGHDLDSAKHLNELIAARFDDVTVFRNDHFLHNQTVQNILGLRFANRVLGPAWCAPHVESVDVRWDETLTLEGRAGYYDRAGALRDMLQNHLLQVTSFAAMEPPVSMAGSDLHQERRRLLRAIATPDSDRVAEHSIRARYTAGRIDGRDVPDYADEDGVDPGRGTETFAQVTLRIEDWRWDGVPFTLRSGKAMADDTAELLVTFRDVPSPVFAAGPGAANQLRVRMDEPGAGMRLNVNAEGELFGLTSVTMDAGLPRPQLSAYAGLLRDVLAGDTTLSVSASEAEEGWRIMQPILDAWSDDQVPLRGYTAGQPLPADWFTP